MNAKIYNGNVQPNPKEYKIWVNDEGLIKTWNGTKWVETASNGGSGSGSGSGDDAVYVQATEMLVGSSFWDMAATVKTKMIVSNNISIDNISTYIRSTDDREPLAFKFYLNELFTAIFDSEGHRLYSVQEVFNIAKEQGLELIYLTKEEFYNLEA